VSFSLEVSVTTDAQLPPRLQLAEELEIGAVHVVTGRGAGKLPPGVGVLNPHGMGSPPGYGVVTSDAKVYGVVSEQRSSSRAMVLVTGETPPLQAVFESLVPVLLQPVTITAHVLIDALLLPIFALVT
jgi:hypothetical protein